MSLWPAAVSASWRPQGAVLRNRRSGVRGDQDQRRHDRLHPRGCGDRVDRLELDDARAGPLVRVSKAITQNWMPSSNIFYMDLGTLLVRSVHVGTGLHDHCQRIVAIYRHICAPASTISLVARRSRSTKIDRGVSACVCRWRRCRVTFTHFGVPELGNLLGAVLLQYLIGLLAESPAAAPPSCSACATPRCLTWFLEHFVDGIDRLAFSLAPFTLALVLGSRGCPPTFHDWLRRSLKVFRSSGLVG